MNRLAESWAAATGVLWAMPFLFTGFAGVAWFVPAMLLLAPGVEKSVSRFRMGYLSGICFHLVALYWLLFMPTLPGAVSAWLVLSAYCALYPAVWVSFCWRMLPPSAAPAPFFALQRRLGALSWSERQFWALAGAAGWTSVEMLQAHLFSGFPWNFLAVSQIEMLPLLQFASLTGVYGVSFLTAWVSLSLGLAVAGIAVRPGRPWVWGREILPAGLGLVIVWTWGFQRIQDAPWPAAHLRIALIQPSVEQELIWKGESQEERFRELLDLSAAALAVRPRPDLLVWPESALPVRLKQPERVASFIRERRVPLIFNAVDTSQPPAGAEPLYYNAAFLMNRNGRIIGRAHKRQLVMFGEYIPLADTLPFLKSLSPIGPGYARGEEPGILELDDPPIAIGTLICFEDAFPALARETAQRHPDFLVNLTNAAWFGDSKAQWQQTRAAAFRAIETNLPLVRCTNNGITCWIDPYGRIQTLPANSPEDIYKKGFQIAEIPLPNPAPTPTRYRRSGDFFGWSCVAFSLSLLLIREWRRIRKRIDEQAPAPLANPPF